MSRTVVQGQLQQLSGQDFPICEDIDLKGGYMVVADTTARDAIATNRRKEGMEVRTIADGKKWVLASDLTTWNELIAIPAPTRRTTAGPVTLSRSAWQKWANAYASGAITYTLPATPQAGDVIEIGDAIGTASTNNITINPNGKQINGDGTNLVVDIDYAWLVLVFDGTQWVIS